MTRFGAPRTSDAAKAAEVLRRPWMQDRGSQEEQESRFRKMLRVIEALSVRVKGGGDVTVDDGGSVVVNDGGTVVINDGGRIEVYDNNEVLRVVVGKDEDDYDVSLFDSSGANKIALSQTIRDIDADSFTAGLTPSNTSFADTGVEVSTTVGESGLALVQFGATLGATYDESSGNFKAIEIGFRVSGATTIATGSITGFTTLTPAITRSAGTATLTLSVPVSALQRLTSLNPGATTFTMQHRKVGSLAGADFLTAPYMSVIPL